MDETIGTATFTDSDGNPVESDNLLNWDGTGTEDEAPDLYLPCGIVLYNPNKGILVIVRDEDRASAFTTNADKGLDSYHMDESDIEDVSLAVAFFSLLAGVTDNSDNSVI